MTETTTRTDVNAQFNASRLAEVGRIENLRSAEGQAAYIAEQTARFDARVASGELVKLGEGRYQSTQGWDRGEVWTVRSVNGQSLVLPEHGIDMNETTGRARLYSAVPAWHGLGQVIPGGITDIEDVIRLGQLDVPAYHIPAASYEVPGIGLVTPSGLFHVGNGTTGEYWGTVGKVHKNVDVRTSFGFMQNVVGKDGITWESAGLMGGGRKVFISCKVNGGITIDAKGVGDYTELFLVVQDTRDGSSSYRAMITPWRPICQNTNRFATRDAVSTIALRHTSGLPSAIEKARTVLGVTTEYAKSYAAEGTRLARTDTTLAQFEATMAELFGDGKKDTDASGRVFSGRIRAQESTRTKLANDRREDALQERFAVESKRVGTTLYATEQAYTGYLDWDKVRKGGSKVAAWQNRIEASLDGEDEKLKNRAHGRLLQLAGGGTEKR